MRKIILVGVSFFLLTGNVYANKAAENMCKQASYLAGADGGWSEGFCRGTHHSVRFWGCVAKAIAESGKRGYSNDDAGNIISYGIGFGGCR